MLKGQHAENWVVATCKIAPFHCPAPPLPQCLNWGLTVSQAGGWVGGWGVSDQLCFISIVRVVREAGAALDCSHTQISPAHQWQPCIEVTHF